MGLAQQSCQPQQSPLAPEDAATLHQEVRDWGMTERSLARAFVFDDFAEAMDFVNDVACLAGEEDHHPDIHVSYNKVNLELTTHKVQGLSKNDFIMAAKIDQLVA